MAGLPLNWSKGAPQPVRSNGWARNRKIEREAIGHATFETPDLEKTIAYFTEVNGLKLATARRTGRSSPASRPAHRPARQGDEATLAPSLSFEVAPNSDFDELAASSTRRGIRASCATTRSRASARCSAFKTTRAPPSNCSASGSYSAVDEQGARAPGREAPGMSPFVGAEPDRRTADSMGAVMGLSGIRLDRRLLRLHALQHRSSHRQFSSTGARQASSQSPSS